MIELHAWATRNPIDAGCYAIVMIGTALALAGARFRLPAAFTVTANLAVFFIGATLAILMFRSIASARAGGA